MVLVNTGVHSASRGRAPAAHAFDRAVLPVPDMIDEIMSWSLAVVLATESHLARARHTLGRIIDLNSCARVLRVS